MKDSDTIDLCQQVNSFHCGKKCISKHRLVDSFTECFDNSDETFNDSCTLNDKYRQKQITITDDVARCYKPTLLLNYGDNIGYMGILQVPHFPTICDGYLEFREGSDTDETDCEHWLCDNQYTRCNYIWNCLNGKDEAGCSYSPCGIDEHPCLSMDTTRLMCLPLSQAGDGHVDCWGATDERQFCRTEPSERRYLCREVKSTYINSTSG
jgi:hypothetical protein